MKSKLNVIVQLSISFRRPVLTSQFRIIVPRQYVETRVIVLGLVFASNFQPVRYGYFKFDES